MARLTDDEKKLLAELTARESAPDDDDAFEIEVYDTEKGKGARIPYSKGKGWLHEVFGIGQPDAPAGGEGDGAGTGDGAGAGGEGGDGKGRAGAGGGYFGRR